MAGVTERSSSSAGRGRSGWSRPALRGRGSRGRAHRPGRSTVTRPSPSVGLAADRPRPHVRPRRAPDDRRRPRRRRAGRPPGARRDRPRPQHARRLRHRPGHPPRDAQARRVHDGRQRAPRPPHRRRRRSCCSAGWRRSGPIPGSTTVTTVNGGVVGLTRTLVEELKPLRVNSIHPGVVGDSPYWSEKPAAIAKLHVRDADRPPGAHGRDRRRGGVPAREHGRQRRGPDRRRRLALPLAVVPAARAGRAFPGRRRRRGP